MLILFDNGTPAPLRYRQYIERVVAAVGAATPGSYTEVDIPFA